MSVTPLQPHPNTVKLKHLVREYQLSLRQLSEITSRTMPCVKAWHSGRHRTIPTDTLSLLEIRLKELRDKGQL
jgi:hypothetical protein